MQRTGDRAGAGTSSGEDFLDRMPQVHFQAFVSRDLKLTWVEAQLVQQGGVNVGDVMSILDRVKTDFVGCAMGDATSNAASRKANGKAVRMVVPSI